MDYFRLVVGESGVVDVSRRYKASSNPGSSLFIDLDLDGNRGPGAVADAVGHLTKEIDLHDEVIVRLPASGPSELVRISEALFRAVEVYQEITLRLDLSPGNRRIGLLLHPTDGPPVVAFPDDREMSATRAGAAREAEISALMEAGECRSSPADYVFVLPNGSIASTFVRFGDSIRDERDTEVMAYWIFGVLRTLGPTVGVLIDTPSLLPVVTTLRRFTDPLEQHIERIEVAPAYPNGVGDVETVLRGALRSSDSLLVVLSVSASGRFLALIERALSTGSLAQRSSITVVMHERGRSLTWPLNRANIVTFTSEVSEDGLPRGSSSKPEVAVEPPLFRLQPRLITAAPGALPLPADRDLQFLQMASEHKAVGVECTPHSDVLSVRPRSRLLSFRVILDSLTPSQEFRDAAVRGLLGLRGWFDAGEMQELVVLLPDGDIQSSGPDSVYVRDCIEGLGFHGELAMLSAADFSGVGRSRTPILLWTWGSVTGSTLLRALRRVRSAVGESDVAAVVVHFRPPSLAERASLESEFGEGRFWTSWTQYVPWGSVLSPEASRIVDYLGSGAVRGTDSHVFEDRLRLLSPVGQNRDWTYRVGDADDALGDGARRLLWLTEPTSRADDGDFEWLQDQVACLYGASSQIHGRRIARSGNAPIVNVETLELAPGATYAACSVRAARVGELWFGDTGPAHTETAERLCDWIHQDWEERSVVLGELLLADTLGKVPRAASQVLRDYATDVASQQRLPDAQAAQLIALTRFVDWAWNER